MDKVKTICVNGELNIGDLVIATPGDSDYACLVGKVFTIIPVGSPGHDTSNDTDDVYVNFLEHDYSENRKAEISEIFSMIYKEKTAFEDCPLDEVIMAPCCLIRLTGIDESSLKRLLDSGYNAACYCYRESGGLSANIHSDAGISASGAKTKNAEMPRFKISRTLNGESVDIELTEQELLNAHNFQEKIFYVADIETILGEMVFGGKLSGDTADMIRADIKLIKIIMEAYEEKIEEYDNAWRRAVTEAINENINGVIKE